MDWTKRWVAGHLIVAAETALSQANRFLALALTHSEGLTQKERLYLDKRGMRVAELKRDLGMIQIRIQKSCGKHASE